MYDTKYICSIPLCVPPIILVCYININLFINIIVIGSLDVTVDVSLDTSLGDSFRDVVGELLT